MADTAQSQPQHQPQPEVKAGTEPQTIVTAIVQPEGPDAETTEPIPVEVDLNQVYTFDELVLHNKDGDLWLAIDGTVYDLTKFSGEHPGGKKILLGVAGTDASKKYRKYHGDNILKRYAYEYKIGTLKIEVKEKESKGFFSRFKKKK
ncbi:cytochrome b5-like heme/steroid binding domain-containing protein [Aspergillus pseudodeflectus]|uniref:Cytochrome b5-like heme/steroid binding domain-containing protein n=1 Tax=Aspergillus pseudodeflectus TaxID=176178 RepID=A0ABR4L437_9EURO